MRDITKVIIHCSDSPQGRGDSAETIHRWHKERGWDGVGYHYIVDEFGNVENGRPEYWIGSHVKGHNSDSIGICMIGKGTYTATQFIAVLKTVDMLLNRYPKATLHEHCYFDSKKECPEFTKGNLAILSYLFKDRFISKNLEELRIKIE